MNLYNIEKVYQNYYCWVRPNYRIFVLLFGSFLTNHLVFGQWFQWPCMVRIILIRLTIAVHLSMSPWYILSYFWDCEYAGKGHAGAADEIDKAYNPKDLENVYYKVIGSKSILGGSRINRNKSDLLSHFSSSFVCFAYTNGKYWGGSSPSPPPLSPLQTALN